MSADIDIDPILARYKACYKYVTVLHTFIAYFEIWIVIIIFLNLYHYSHISSIGMSSALTSELLCMQLCSLQREVSISL